MHIHQKERIELILNVAKPTAVIAVHEWPELAAEVPVITAEELTRNDDACTSACACVDACHRSK